MSKQIELEKLDRAIKDSQIRLCTVKSNIELLDREVETLSRLEVQLESNLKCLKKKDIIPIASEFKKAKEDLGKTRIRLITVKNEREDFKKAMDHVNQCMDKAREEIEKIKKIGENNVLHGKFGKDHG